MVSNTLVQHMVIVFRTGGGLEQPEYYAGNQLWLPDRSEAKPLEEDYANSLIGGLRLKPPYYTYETLGL